MNILQKKWSKQPIVRIYKPVVTTVIENHHSYKIDTLNTITNINDLKQYINNLDHGLANNNVCNIMDGDGKYCIIHEYYKKNNTSADKQLVHKIFDKLGINESDITNIYLIPFNLDTNTHIDDKDMIMFGDIMRQLLDIIKPQGILTLGSTVAKSLFINESIQITHMRGSKKELTINDHTINVMMTLHPISVLKKKEYLRLFTDDILSYISLFNDN